MPKTTRTAILGELIIAAGGTVSTTGGDHGAGYINKIESGDAMVGIECPGSVNTFLFPQASVDKVLWYNIEDTTNTLIYRDGTAITQTRWWMVKADIFPAHYIRLASMTNANGTAGSVLANGGTFRFMGFS